MPSVLTPVNGDIFTVHVIKHLIDNPGAIWSNTYDFKVLDATSGTVFTGPYTAALNFEVDSTLNTVHFDEVRVSTFLPDSHPYNPESFIAIPVDEVGTRVAGSDPLPLGYAWLILRNAASGRSGKLFLRGGLAEASVNSQGGLPAFLDPHSFAVQLVNSANSTHLSDFYDGTAPDAEMVIASYNRTTHAVSSRPVNALTSRGPILAKLSRKRKRHIIAGG